MFVEELVLLHTVQTRENSTEAVHIDLLKTRAVIRTTINTAAYFLTHPVMVLTRLNLP